MYMYVLNTVVLYIPIFLSILLFLTAQETNKRIDYKSYLYSLEGVIRCVIAVMAEAYISTAWR